MAENIDSTFCKVRRGGKTTKIHALVNENFQLLQVILGGGQVGDNEVAIKLFGNLNIEGKNILFIKLAILFIKNFRRIATRYDKLSICFLNFVLLAAVMIKI